MRIIALADLHLAPADEPPTKFHHEWDFAGAAARLQDSVRLARLAQASLLVVLGDISHHGDLAATVDAVRQVAACGVDARFVAGNHDWQDRVPVLPRALDRVGDPRLRMARPSAELMAEDLAVAGVELLASPPSSSGPDTFDGRLAVDEWPAGPAILLSHFPVISRSAELRANGLSDPGDLTNQRELRDALIARRRPTVALTAHVHARDWVNDGTLLHLGCAAQIETPHDVSIVDVVRAGENVHVRRQAISLAAAGGFPPWRKPVVEGAWTYKDEPGAWQNEPPAGSP